MYKDTWHIDDFTLCFSAQAHDPLFEEMIFRDYVPDQGKRIIVLVGKLLSEYTESKALVDIRRAGEKILTESVSIIVHDLEANMVLLNKMALPVAVTTETLEEVYMHLGEVLRLYGKLDTWYTEGLYTKDGLVKPGREETVRRVEESKNRLRAGQIEKTFFLGDGYFQRFLQTVTDQYQIPKKDILQYRKQELLDLITNGKKLATHEVDARKRAYVFFGDSTECRFLAGIDAEDFYTGFCKDESSLLKNEKTLTGTVAYKGGVVRGLVQVLITNQDISVEEARQALVAVKGKILVLPIADARLDADYCQAAALITDVGGLLSHAAIVAREFHIPCIIGTKNATKVLKDGDLVEVDANTGIVRILD